MQHKPIKISLKNVSKTFQVREQKQVSALSHAISLFKALNNKKSLTPHARVFSGNLKKHIQAVNQLSLDVYEGESLGVIGKNGSGKSTLLRLIAEIHDQDSGEIQRYGRVVYVSGFTHGLKPKLTMRDNIYLVASILGLPQNKIEDIFDQIVEFSDLGEFVDTKIYTFSSGMIARLAFSIGIHALEELKPDIILLDEVVGAGGDIDFVKKANVRMDNLIQGTATVIFVSHSLHEIQKYCTRVLWMEKGNAKKIGDTNSIIAEYTAQ